MKMSNHVSTALKSILKDRGTSQTQLADDLGKKYSWINGIVNGRIQAGTASMRSILAWPALTPKDRHIIAQAYLRDEAEAIGLTHRERDLYETTPTGKAIDALYTLQRYFEDEAIPDVRDIYFFEKKEKPNG